MSNRLTLLCALGLVCAAPVLALVVPPAEEPFKPSDHEKLGKLISTYIAARGANKGLDKAQEELDQELTRHEKRLKRSPLAYPLEMGKALWASYDYDKNQKVKKGKVDLIELPAYYDPKAKLAYAVWTPTKYDPKKSYPLLLCIPDKGEKPLDHITEKWSDAAIRENAIIVAIPMPSDEKLWLESGTAEKEGGAGNVLFTLGQVSRNYAIDFDRAYLAGRGLGVEAALTVAARYLDRFAGVVGRSGDAPDGLAVENLQQLPIFFAGAGAKATALEEQLKKLGYATVQRKDDATEADIWAWVQAHPRQANPSTVVLYPGSPVPTRAFWLESVPTDAQGTVYIKATVDRTSNTITIEGEGITKFLIYFNDLMLDLDKPVQIVANGSPLSRTIQRSLPRALDFLYSARSDPGRFYVQNMQFDLPAKPKPPPVKPGEAK